MLNSEKEQKETLRRTILAMNDRLPKSFFIRNVLDVAPGLLGKILVRRFSIDHIEKYQITEVEA